MVRCARSTREAHHLQDLHLGLRFQLFALKEVSQNILWQLLQPCPALSTHHLHKAALNICRLHAANHSSQHQKLMTEHSEYP